MRGRHFSAAEVGGVGFGSLLDQAAAACEFGEVALDVGDLVAHGEDVGGVDEIGEALLVVSVDEVGVVAQQPVEWCGGGVVGLADGGAGAGFGEELLLGQEQVDLSRGKRPQLVEQVELAAAVVAEVADVATHH